MQTSKDILRAIQEVDRASREAYMLGKRVDISALMVPLQLESFANIARIKELLEEKLGVEPLDYEPESERVVELRRDVDSEEWKKENNSSS